MQVDAAEEEEAFADVATAALNILLLGLETKLDACLGSLMRANWASVESVRNSIKPSTKCSTRNSRDASAREPRCLRSWAACDAPRAGVRPVIDGSTVQEAEQSSPEASPAEDHTRAVLTRGINCFRLVEKLSVGV